MFSPENFKSLNNLSEVLENYIKMSRNTYMWLKLLKQTFLPKFNVYVHVLSPLPMQNPYSKSYLFIFTCHPISKIFLEHFTTNLWLNIGKIYLTLSFVN